MEIVPRDQDSHFLVVHAIFYFENFSETIESSNRQVIEIESLKTPYCCWSRFTLMGPVPRAMAFKKEKTKTLGSGLGSKFRSESMQKSTKIADSWQGSKNQNRSSFADWYTLVSLQTLCSFFFERSIRFREKRRKPFQAPQAISQAKNRVEIIMIRWTRVPIQSR